MNSTGYANAPFSLRTPLCLFHRPNLVATAAFLISFAVIDTANGISAGMLHSQSKSPNPSHSGGRTPSPSINQRTASTSDPPTPDLQTPLNRIDDDSIVTGGYPDSQLPVDTTSQPDAKDLLGQGPTVVTAPSATGLSADPSADEGTNLSLSLDYLVSSQVAGPWMQAFGIQEVELNELNGEILIQLSPASDPLTTFRHSGKPLGAL